MTFVIILMISKACARTPFAIWTSEFGSSMKGQGGHSRGNGADAAARKRRKIYPEFAPYAFDFAAPQVEPANVVPLPGFGEDRQGASKGVLLFGI